jgi:acyl-CoA dehydrogenase
VQVATTAGPDADQAKDLALMLVLGELFTLVVYGHLILEQGGAVDRDVIDQVFDVLVLDFSDFAVDLHGKASSSKAQQLWALDHVRKPAADAARYDRVWQQVRDCPATTRWRRKQDLTCIPVPIHAALRSASPCTYAVPPRCSR